MITKESIENLSQRLNIVDIIENYIEVKKQGQALFACVLFTRIKILLCI